MSTTEEKKDSVPDIEDLHRGALKDASSSYIDPVTGFTCFTELLHLKRGTCCGNNCRHCPYGWEEVPNQSRPAKLRSGDYEAAQKMVQNIIDGNSHLNELDVLKANGTAPPEIADDDACAAGSATPRTSKASCCDTHARKATAPPRSKAEKSTKIKIDEPPFKRTTPKNVPYTRSGDKGTSMLLTGERRRKDDPNFEALGSVDEVCCVVGVVYAHLDDDEDYGPLQDQLLDVMSRLFDVGSHVAKPRFVADDGKEFVANGVGDGISPELTEQLEGWINAMTDEMPELTSFILPTGAKAASHLHVARTVCRRTERRMIELVDDKTCDPNALQYVNRLSDYFFTAARWVNYCEGVPEIQYQRKLHSTQRQRIVRSLQKEKKDDD